jgi:hypothetical protein
VRAQARLPRPITYDRTLGLGRRGGCRTNFNLAWGWPKSPPWAGLEYLPFRLGEQPPVGAIQLRRLLEAAGRKSKRNRYHRRFANNLLKVWPAPWTFATHPEVEPTNNPAEPALRGPVIHRELSHGTRSDDGERFAERVLSAAATCRQQQRSLVEFLTDLLTAHTRSDPLPALT